MICSSIILPSRNGAETLPLVFEALAALEPVDGEFEILLVDNASTDETLKLMNEFSSSFGARVLTEPQTGKSFALNAGIDAAQGKMLIFLDDDAIPKSGWLAAMHGAARRQSQAGAFAGAVKPHWLCPPPDWLAKLADQGRCCGCTPPDRSAGKIEPGKIKGANFAVLREALGNLRFDTGGVNFGQSKVPAGGEDTLFALALAARGVTMEFVPDAEVGHVISAKESTLSAQILRSVRIGRGENLIHAHGMVDLVKAAAKISILSAFAVLRYAGGNRTEAAANLLAAAKNFGILDHSFRKVAG